MLAPDRLAELAAMFRLMGDATRLKILFSCLDRARAVGDIAAEIGASASLVSHHLRLLRTARLVRAERRGQRIFYSAADAHVRAVLGDMGAHAAEPRLVAPGAKPRRRPRKEVA